MSRTIDERIISLKFDNAQFEHNVRVSMSTMNDLKKSLNFSGMEKGIDATAKSVGQVNKKMGILGATGFTAIQRLTNATITQGKKMASALIDPIVAGGKKRALALAQARFQIEGLGMDVDRVMEDVNYAVDGTSYSLAEAANAASMFGASGIKAGQEMKDALRGISGVAAMAGASYEDVANVFTKVAGQGRLMGDDLNRLAARGINAAATLGKQMGKTEKEIREMVTKGEISFEMFSESMNLAFGDHATKANETYRGSLDNVRNALARMGEKFFTPYYKSMIPVNNEFREFINRASVSLEPAINTAIKAVEKFNKALAGFLKNLDPNDIFGSLPKVADVLSKAAKGIVAALSWMGDKTGMIFSKIKDLIGSLMSFVGENLTFSNILKGAGIAGIILIFKKIQTAYYKAKSSLNNMLNIANLDKFIVVLNEIQAGLSSFIKGIQVSSLVAISASILILAFALEKISKIKIGDTIKALGGIGALFLMMQGALLMITKNLKGVLGVRFLSAGIGMMFLAVAINKLTDALVKMSKIRARDLTKSLAGLFGTLKALSIFINSTTFSTISIKSSAAILIMVIAVTKIADALKVIGEMRFEQILKGLGGLSASLYLLFKLTYEMQILGSKGHIKNAAAILILSLSLSKIADALSDIGKLSWGEIAKGLTGLTGGITALSGAATLMGKFASSKSIAGSASVLILSKTLGEIAEALSAIGKLSWNGITKGLTGMGIALAELSAVSIAIGKFSKKSIIGSATLVIGAQSLGKLADALYSIGKMSWNSVAKGIAGMTGALLSLGGVSGILGKTTHIFGMIGATSLVIGVQSLQKLADALVTIGTMSWSEVGRGVTGLLGALTSLGAISGLLGALTHVFGIIGSASLVIGVNSLKKLSEALGDIGEMSWAAIGRGITGLLGALSSLAGGAVLNTAGILGVISLSKLVGPLKVIVEEFQKLSKMSWGEIKTGITAMAGVFAVIAKGSLQNSLSFLGSWSIGTIAGPLGALGEAMTKWKNVTVPKDLARGLTEIAMGVMAFSPTVIGSASLLILGDSLGKLADSIKKWKDVTFPQNLTTNLVQLSDGIKAFTWVFLGAASIGPAAKGLADLANAVKAWKDVVVPEDLPEKLRKLSDAIKSWGLTFISGFSINEVAKPMGILADSMKSWEKVKIDEDLPASLKTLADGIKSFAWMLTEGISLSGIAKPFGDLADSMKKWSSVEIPNDMLSSLQGLANGIKSFSWMLTEGLSMSTMAKPFGEMANSVKKWKDVSLPKNLSTTLDSLANGLRKFAWMFTEGPALKAMAEPFGVLANSVKKWKDVSLPEGLSETLKTLSNALKNFRWMFDSPDAIATIAAPFGIFATSVNKWKDVTIPKDIHQSLSRLASGIKQFNKLGDIGEKLGILTGPFKDMAGSVNAWKDVTVPENLKTNLTALATGIGSFTKTAGAGENIAAIVGPLRTLASTITAWTNVIIPTSLKFELGMVAKSLGSFVKIEGVGKTINAILPGFNGLRKALSAWGNLEFPKSIKTQLKDVASGMSAFSKDINLTPIANGLKAMSSALGTFISKTENTKTQLTSMGNAFGNAATKINKSVSNISLSISGFATIKKVISSMNLAVSSEFNKLGKNLNSAQSKITTAFRKMSTTATVGSVIMKIAFKRTGEAIVTGVKNGFDNKWPGFKIYVLTKFANLVASVNNQLGIHSPSRVFFKIGRQIMEGLALGIRKSSVYSEDVLKTAAQNLLTIFDDVFGTIPKTISERFKEANRQMILAMKQASSEAKKSYKAAKKVSDKATKDRKKAEAKAAKIKKSKGASSKEYKAAKKEVERLKKQEATAKKVTAAAKKDVNAKKISAATEKKAYDAAVKKEKNLEKKRKAAQAKATRAEKKYGKNSKQAKAARAEVARLRKLEKAAEKNVKSTKKTYSAAKKRETLYKKRLATLKKHQDAFAKLETQQTKLNEELETARAKYEEIAAYQDNVTNSFVEVAKLSSVQGARTMGEYIDGLKDNLEEAKLYSENLTKLAEMGVSKEFIDEIVSSGVKAGSATVQYLLDGATTESIEELNNFYKEIAALGNSTGDTLATQFFGMGKDVALGIVEGLESQIEKITSQMEKIGDKIVAAFEKIMQMKSPSRRMREKGVNVIQGVIDGVKAMDKPLANSMKEAGNLMSNEMGKVINLIDYIDVPAFEIKPILNLDDFRTGVDSMNDMIGSQSIAASVMVPKRSPSTTTTEGPVPSNQNGTTEISNNTTIVQNFNDRTATATEVYNAAKFGSKVGG